MEIQSNFTQERNEVAERLYVSLIENYSPVPNSFIEEKSTIIHLIKTAWTHGANWQHTEHYKEAKSSYL